MVNIMLVEFHTKNFRSLRDEQVLSLVASKDKTLLATNTIATGVNATPRLLCSAAVYGANASGKSNLIKALQYMRGVVMTSANQFQPGQTFDIAPFRLNGINGSQATEFEVTFLIGKVRYQYGFTLTAERIVSEYLLVYKAFKPQRWFDRYWDAATGKDIYEFSASLKGAKSVWEGATRGNALFLSMAVQLNSEQLRPVFDWFINQLVVINQLALIGNQFSLQILQQPEKRKAICNFLAAADISITDIDVVTHKKSGQVMHFDLAAGKSELRAEEFEENQLRFHHVTEHGEAMFNLEDESTGTRNLLSLAGPLLDMLNKGRTLVIDELDASLHPLLVRQIVRLFHTPEINTNGAQLVFTTHDTSLLDAPDLLRRDQVWIVEKDRDQASSLVSLAEFSPRKTEALERGYLMGRYGGIPFINDMTELEY